MVAGDDNRRSRRPSRRSRSSSHRLWVGPLSRVSGYRTDRNGRDTTSTPLKPTTGAATLPCAATAVTALKRQTEIVGTPARRLSYRAPGPTTRLRRCRPPWRRISTPRPTSLPSSDGEARRDTVVPRGQSPRLLPVARPDTKGGQTRLSTAQPAAPSGGGGRATGGGGPDVTGAWGGEPCGRVRAGGVSRLAGLGQLLIVGGPPRRSHTTPLSGGPRVGRSGGRHPNRGAAVGPGEAAGERGGRTHSLPFDTKTRR